jgi:hypothetical protein
MKNKIELPVGFEIIEEQKWELILKKEYQECAAYVTIDLKTRTFGYGCGGKTTITSGRTKGRSWRNHLINTACKSLDEGMK